MMHEEWLSAAHAFLAKRRSYWVAGRAHQSGASCRGRRRKEYVFEDRTGGKGWRNFLTKEPVDRLSLMFEPKRYGRLPHCSLRPTLQRHRAAPKQRDVTMIASRARRMTSWRHTRSEWAGISSGSLKRYGFQF